uniref:DUF6570 domain-containing protein n=1 Tax=Amphimedon queenslandica TaxID=400682 RepID=A0A1X7U168_AMPQE
MVGFHESISSLTFLTYETCLEQFPNMSVSRQPNRVNECRRCATDKHIPKLYSSGNNINPGPVPPQLQDLSQAEEMLVSAIMPVMSIYRLLHGQCDYSGHVINFPQDIKSFATRLPRLPTEINIVVVCKESERTHKDFQVCRRFVKESLTWLMANNVYYQKIGVSLDQDTLAMLPEDGDLSDLCTFQPVEFQSGTTSNDTTTTEDVPNAAPPATERETIEQAIIGGTPINEFQTEGYFSMAFPILFPTGAAYFNGTQMNGITAGHYFTHLIK